MTNKIIRYDIYLLPYIKLREEEEQCRALRARKRTKVANIPCRFPSVNRMYPHNKSTGSKYLSAEGRIYKKFIYDAMTVLDDQRSIKLHEYYKCYYVYYMTHSMMYTKSCDLRKTDVSNYLKGTEDAVFEYLDDDDSLVVDISGYKRLTVGDPKLVILLEEGDPSGPIYIGGEFIDSYDLEEDVGGVLL